MMLMICADVLLRNVALVPALRGLAWSNEISEAMLYLITHARRAVAAAAQGQHIRVDIVLRALPQRVAWLLRMGRRRRSGFACCLC